MRHAVNRQEPPLGDVDLFDRRRVRAFGVGGPTDKDERTIRGGLEADGDRHASFIW